MPRRGYRAQFMLWNVEFSGMYCQIHLTGNTKHTMHTKDSTKKNNGSFVFVFVPFVSSCSPSDARDRGRARYDRRMRRICVFCGSAVGANTAYADAAREMGRVLVERGISLVYGGGHVGLMGVIADTVLAAGGEAIGVIPHGLAVREVAHKSLTKLHVVGSMHERKAMMAELSDAFVAAPGGFGTLEELCEVVTWSQLGLHRKRCGLLNVLGFYDPLLDLFDRAVKEGFIQPVSRQIVVSDSTPSGLLDQLAAPLPGFEPVWIRTPAQT